MLQVYFNDLRTYKLAIWTCKRKQTNFTIEKCKNFTDLENQQQFGPSLLHQLIYFSIFESSWSCMHYIVKDSFWAQ